MLTSITIAIQFAFGKHAFWVTRVTTWNSTKWFPVCIATWENFINNTACFCFIDIPHHHYRHHCFLLCTFLQFYKVWPISLEFSSHVTTGDQTINWNGTVTPWDTCLGLKCMLQQRRHSNPSSWYNLDIRGNVKIFSIVSSKPKPYFCSYS